MNGIKAFDWEIDGRIKIKIYLRMQNRSEVTNDCSLEVEFLNYFPFFVLRADSQA